MVHLGHPPPQGDDLAHRGEGVGIFLNSVASEAWRQAGKLWKAVQGLS